MLATAAVEMLLLVKIVWLLSTLAPTVTLPVPTATPLVVPTETTWSWLTFEMVPDWVSCQPSRNMPAELTRRPCTS